MRRTKTDYLCFVSHGNRPQYASRKFTDNILVPATPHGVLDQRDANIQKHQAVFSIDYPTWQMFIDAFDIRESIIPNRELRDVNVSSGGWYTG